MGIRFTSKRLGNEIKQRFDFLAHNGVKETMQWNFAENKLFFDCADDIYLIVNGKRLEPFSEPLDVSEPNPAGIDHYHKQFQKHLFGDQPLNTMQTENLNKLYALINQNFCTAISLELSQFLWPLLENSTTSIYEPVYGFEIASNEQGQITLKIKAKINLKIRESSDSAIIEPLYEVEAFHIIGNGNNDVQLKISEARNDPNLTQILNVFQENYPLAKRFFEVKESYGNLKNLERKYIKEPDLKKAEKMRIKLVADAQKTGQEVQLLCIQAPYIKPETQFESLPIATELPTSKEQTQKNIEVLCRNAQEISQQKVQKKLASIDATCKTIADTYCGRNIKKSSYSDILASIWDKIGVKSKIEVDKVYSKPAPSEATPKATPTSTNTPKGLSSLMSWFSSFFKTPQRNVSINSLPKSGDSAGSISKMTLSS